MTPHELKSLEVRRFKIQAQITQVQADARLLQRQATNLQTEARQIEEKIRNATRTGPTVSEHAILRYAERVMGLDVKAVGAAILTPEIAEKIEALGSGKFPLEGGVTAVVKDRCVVSIVETR